MQYCYLKDIQTECDHKNVASGYADFKVNNIESLDLDDRRKARYKLHLEVTDRHNKKHEVKATVQRYSWELLNDISRSVGLRWYYDFGFEPDKITGRSGKMGVHADGKKRLSWFSADKMEVDERRNRVEDVILYGVEPTT